MAERSLNAVGIRLCKFVAQPLITTAAAILVDRILTFVGLSGHVHHDVVVIAGPDSNAGPAVLDRCSPDKYVVLAGGRVANRCRRRSVGWTPAPGHAPGIDCAFCL